VKALRSQVMSVSFVTVWSSGYVVGAIAARTMAPLAVTMWRFFVAAAILGTAAVLRRERWPNLRDALRLLGVGVPLFAIQFGALYTALADGLPAGTTALIACSSPLVVAAIGAGAGWERLRPVQWVGILLGAVGVAVTLADKVGRPPSVASLVWALSGLAALAIGTTLHGRVRTDAGPAAVAATEIAAGAVVLAVWAPAAGNVAIPLDVDSLVSFAWLAVVTGVGAPLLLFALVRQHGPTYASSHLFVVPAVTAFAAWPILGTPVGPLALVGLAVVAVALYLAIGRARPVRRSSVDRATRSFLRSASRTRVVRVVASRSRTRNSPEGVGPVDAVTTANGGGSVPSRGTTRSSQDRANGLPAATT
jgi:drug/metabolite transporter (DMT)-like permease